MNDDMLDLTKGADYRVTTDAGPVTCSTTSRTNGNCC
jgi:hypothetical protein